MAINNYRVVVTMFPTNGLVEDRVINTWYFLDAVSTPTSRSLIAGALFDFYNAVNGTAVQSIASSLSASISRVETPIASFYELPDPVGSPVEIIPFAAWDAAGQVASMPTETALVLSYHAELTGVAESEPQPPVGPAGDVHPRARRRGRLYLGPWVQSAADVSTSLSRPSNQIITAVQQSADALLDTALTWQVWSRKDAVGRDVVGGWVDNAWDTQRRRGPDPTARTFFT